MMCIQDMIGSDGYVIIILKTSGKEISPNMNKGNYGLEKTRY